MTFQVSVEVLPKEGMLDPQADAVHGSLQALGFSQVREVRVGRLINLSIEAENPDQARALADRMAKDLLANPVMECYRLEVLG